MSKSPDNRVNSENLSDWQRIARLEQEVGRLREEVKALNAFHNKLLGAIALVGLAAASVISFLVGKVVK